MAKTDKAPEKGAKKKDQNKKAGFANTGIVKLFSRIIKFFKEVFYELKKVTWPTKKEIKINTLTVLMITLVAAVMIGLLDWGMGTLYRLVIQ